MKKKEILEILEKKLPANKEFCVNLIFAKRTGLCEVKFWR